MHQIFPQSEKQSVADSPQGDTLMILIKNTLITLIKSTLIKNTLIKNTLITLIKNTHITLIKKRKLVFYILITNWKASEKLHNNQKN